MPKFLLLIPYFSVITLAASSVWAAQNTPVPPPAPPPVQDPLSSGDSRTPSATAGEALPDPLHPSGQVARNNATATPRGTLSFTFENDIFSGRDDGYTNGVRGSWTTSAETVPTLMYRFANLLPFFPQNADRRASYALGQSMFTPNNIRAYSLQEQDRPYAGWLYGSIGLISDTGSQYDTLEVTLGIIGPASLAKPTQRFVHEYITDSPIPRGWYHQLDNEPGIIISRDRKWRSFYQFSALGHGVDFTPHVGISLGNVMTDAKTGATVRIGRNLPSDYGPPRIRPSLAGSDFFIPTRGLGWYLFAGVEGRFVARNIFLDGNTFSSSHSVDKENWVGDLQTGLAITYDTWRVAYTHVFRTREYETQNSAESFGAFTVSKQF